MVKTITRDDIKRHLDNSDPIILVEALPEKYYWHTHLPGARHLPHQQVHKLAPKVLPNKDDFIVVYCANTPCTNSTETPNALVKLGYSNVAEYIEGKQDWIDAGLPTECGA